MQGIPAVKMAFISKIQLVNQDFGRAHLTPKKAGQMEGASPQLGPLHNFSAQTAELAEHVKRQGQQLKRFGLAAWQAGMSFQQGRDIAVESQSEFAFFSDRKRCNDLSLPVVPALTSTGITFEPMAVR